MSFRIDGIGNLGDDPARKSVRVKDESVQVVEFDVYFDHAVPDSDGVYQERDGSWAKISVWKEKLGDRLMRHLEKGAKVLVHGTGRVARWTDEEGKEHKRLDINASYVALDLLCVDSVAFSTRRHQDNVDENERAAS